MCSRDRAYNREYARNYRRQMSEEKKAVIREQCKLRMRRLREKTRNLPKPQLTSQQVKRMRAKWREAKRRQREKTSPAAKEKAKFQALQRKVNKLSPQQFADVLMQTTPRKKEYLKRMGVFNSQNTKRKHKISQKLIASLRERADELKKKRDAKSRQRLRTMVKSANGINLIGLRRETFKRYSIIDEEVERRERCDALSPHVRTVVQDFFRDHSRNLPNARSAGKAVLTDTTKRLHTEWSKDATNPRISLSKFQKLRPTTILTVDRTRFVACCCEYCLNVDYLVSLV